MPRYAWFDPNMNPAYVLGWFDTDAFAPLEYPNLPPTECLLELSDAQWRNHFDPTTHWAVKKGKLVKSPHRPAPVQPDT